MSQKLQPEKPRAVSSLLAEFASQLTDLRRLINSWLMPEASKQNKKPPAERAPLEALPEGTLEASPENPAKAPPEAKKYSIWLHFARKKYGKTTKFRTGLYARNR